MLGGKLEKKNRHNSLSLSLGTRPIKQKNIDTGSQQKTHRQLHKHPKKIIKQESHILMEMFPQTWTSCFCWKFIFLTFLLYQRRMGLRKCREWQIKGWLQRAVAKGQGKGPAGPSWGEAVGSTTRMAQLLPGKNWVLILTLPLIFKTLGFSTLICPTGVRIFHPDVEAEKKAVA